MNAKDVVVKVLERYGVVSDLTDKRKKELGIDDCITLMELWGKIGREILDALPKLDRDRVEDIIGKNLIMEKGTAELKVQNIIDQICSLVPAGEVVAEGKVDCLDDWECWLNVENKDGRTVNVIREMEKYHGKPVKIIVVPDKEVEK